MNSPQHFTPRTSVPVARVAGVLLLVGVVLFILPSILHGNPPIEDAAATLEYVAGRTGWTIAHLANILGVVLWVAAAALMRSLPGLPPGAARAAGTVWSTAAAVFAVYFGIHAIGLSTAADQYLSAGADTAAVIERTEALLLVLGSAAFVAQALVGLAVAATGLVLALAPVANRMFGLVGILIGLGWTLGAVMINFAIIVPFMTLAWAWLTVLGVSLCLNRLPFRHAVPPTAE
ncbi:hypothetical protein ACWIE7_07520 [Dietzia sp. NPDC055343]